MTVFYGNTHHGRTFRDRAEAGRQLGRRVLEWGSDAPIVVGLPRGGVPVAYQVALALGAPLDILVVRKIGAPGQPELALGAVGEGGIRLYNHDIIAALGITPTGWNGSPTRPPPRSPSGPSGCADRCPRWR